MSYFTILLIFTSPPLIGLLLWAIFDARRGVTLDVPPTRFALIMLLHIGLALIYTTPWDNYLIKEGVWWYDPALITGIKIGWVPIEEYTFFIVQTLLAGFVLMTAVRYFRAEPIGDFPVRRVSLVSGLLFLLLSALVVQADWKSGTYLALLLPWALTPNLDSTLFWGRYSLGAAQTFGCFGPRDNGIRLYPGCVRHTWRNMGREILPSQRV